MQRNVARYRVKGTHIIQARNWFEKHVGEGSFNELAAKASDGKWPGPVLASTWYDVEPLNSMLVTASTRLSKPVETIATEIAIINARVDLTSVYRAFLRVAGPHLTLAATTRLWANYVAFGEAKAITNEPGVYVGECRALPRSLMSWACGSWCGFIPTAIEVSGGKKCTGQITLRRREETGDNWMLQFSATYT